MAASKRRQGSPMKVEAVFEVLVTLEVPDERAAAVLGRPMRPEWQESMYHLDTIGKVVTMLGRCVAVKDWDLTHLDGWADCQNDWIDGIEGDWTCLDVYVNGNRVDESEPYDFGQDDLTIGQCRGEDPV